MIINHQHQVVFVHIPKCAGRYIRNSLSNLDDLNNFFYFWRQLLNPESGYVDFGRISLSQQSKKTGYIDFAHIPLNTLATNFPDLFECVQTYQSFAVIRDPFARFPSSMEQRYKIFKKKRMTTISNRELKKEITKTIDYLTRNPESIAPEYIHFRPQFDYVFLNGTQIISSLYTINSTKKLLETIGQITGVKLLEKHEHADLETRYQAMAYKNRFFRNAAAWTRPLRHAAFGQIVDKPLKRMAKDYIFRPRNEITLKPFESSYVKNFIQWFYADDLSLYERVRLLED